MVALILAGGKGSRLKKLTKEIPKPLMRVGGSYYLIDFTLNNYIQSKYITGGAIIVQYSLNYVIDYIFDWMTTNSITNFKILPPKTTADENEIQYKSTAHAVYLNLDIISKQNVSDYIVLAADHVYFMDYDKFFKFHIESDADLTISTIKIPIEEAYRFGVFETDENNNIISFEEKPENPKSNLISMGIYIFKKEVLIDVLKKTYPYSPNLDFGNDIIPYMINNEYNVKIYRFNGLWKDMGIIEDLYDFNMQLLSNFQLEKYFKYESIECNRKLPITMNKISKTATIRNCLMSNGIDISGTVINSVLSKNVRIDENSEVINSIILDDVVIKNSKLKNVIVTEKNEIIDIEKITDDLEVL